MYNRYIQSDRGSYVPIPEAPPYSHQNSSHARGTDQEPQEIPKKSPKRPGASLESLKELWNTLANRLHLDPGDLILLTMLYFLYREEADEELLIALGLLLLL